MNDDIACCGYRCKICPAYRGNITGKDWQQMVSDGWFQIYGFRLSAEQCVCDGCLTKNYDNPHRIDTECPVRPCVLAKNISNCAYCDEYICDKLLKRIVNPDEVMSRNNGKISSEEYERFIEPYDNKTSLDNIRKKTGQ